MADLTLTPKDYNYLLAMINHEAGNTISNSLKKGDTNDAFGQIVGLAETWMNRAAAKGASMESVMYHPQLSHFPTQSAPDYSLIQSKANSLDPRIKEIFDGYLYNRSQGEDGLLGKVNQYLNRDVTDALYSQKYRDWYDKSDLVGAYGDKRSGGKTSLQQEFLHNSQMTIPDYTLKVSPEIRLNPSEAAVDNFAAFQNSYQPPPRAVANAPLPPPRPDEFRGDGFVGPINDFSDAITSGLEGAGNAALGGLNAIGDTLSGMFRPSNQNAGPAPGPYDFAQYGSPGGIGDPNFGAGITPGSPPGPAPGPYDFGSGVAGGDTSNGSFGTGLGNPSLTPAPTVGAPAGTATIANLFQSVLGRPADAQTLSAFDAELDSGRMDLNAIQAALRGSQEAQTLGPLGEAKTYSPLDTIYARQFDRAPDAAAVQNWGSVNGADIGALEAQLYGSQEAQTYRASLGDLASLISPGTAPTIGAGPSVGTIGNGGLAGMIGADPATGTLGPAPNQSITATPGIGEYDFASNYLRANADVAAAGINPWEHFLRYGAQEGRAFNTAGDKFDASRYLSENADVQQAGQDALTHYLTYGAAEGRDAPIIGANGTTRDIGSLGLTPTITASLAQYLQPQGMAPTIGPQQNEFSGSFDGDAYLRQNGDVAQAGMDPLQHYLKYGFAEGRAINPGGAHINQAFDPSAYLQQNPDVAAAKLDPLAHFLMNGASEGRAAPTGSNPYSFSNFNVSQGLGPVGPGAFGLSGVTGGAGSPMPAFGGQNVSQGVPNGSFGSGISPYQTISPFGFSGANVSGGLGATAQSLGGSYAVGSAADLGFGGTGGGGGSGGDGAIDPFGFGGDVSGFDVNNLGGSATQESPVAGGYGDGVAIQGRNNQASQNAFIAGEWKKAADSTAAANLLGQQITNVAPGNQTNYALGAINPMQTPSIQQTPFTPVNMSGVFAPMPTAMFMPRFTF